MIHYLNKSEVITKECEDTFTNDTHKLSSRICHHVGEILVKEVKNTCYKQFREKYLRLPQK